MCRWVVALVLACVLGAGCGNGDKKKVDGGTPTTDAVQDIAPADTGYDCGACPPPFDSEDWAELPRDLADEPPPPDLADEPQSPKDTLDVPEPPLDVADTAEIPEPPPDIEPDYQGMPVAAFRITSMTIQHPKFCVGGPGDCQEINAFIETYRRECGQRGIEYVLTPTDTPYDRMLLNYLARRKALFR